MTPILNHLWQSTIFAAAIFALTLALRNNRPGTRYFLWLAASAKFLLPFSLLVSLGSQFEWRSAPSVSPTVTVVASQVTQPFSTVTAALAGQPEQAPFPYLPAIWACGSLVVLAMWLRKALRLRSVIQHATHNRNISAPIPVLSTPSLLEPGVVGVFRPVLLIPEGLLQKLTPLQFQAIIAHEMCHVRRRDNLSAILHMAVEMIFWFHPLVWWIGSRLIDERERACDDEVLRLGNARDIYAESILNVCKFYVQSPLPCASGVTGADLKKRVIHIMTGGFGQSLTVTRKLCIAAVAVSAILIPLMLGALNSSAQATDSLRYDVASIRRSTTADNNSTFGDGPNGGIRGVNVSVQKLILAAYNVRDFQVEGAPDWVRSERFDLQASQDVPDAISPRDMSAAQRRVHMRQHQERLRNLLADRFKLKLTIVNKDLPGYVLTVAKGGHKLKPTSVEENKPSSSINGSPNRVEIAGEGVGADTIATILSSILGRKVMDQTGISTRHDFKANWTPDEAATAAAGQESSGSVFTALQEQLGLKLEARKVPTEVLVITNVERPSEN